MLIRTGYRISYDFPCSQAAVLMLHVEPERERDVVQGEGLRCDPMLPLDEFTDSFGNRCCRMVVPAGRVTFCNDLTVRDSGLPDPQSPDAIQHAVQDLPTDALQFLLASRYCEVDSELNDFAWKTFADAPLGWARVQAVCDFAHQHLRFDYSLARSTRTALDAFREGVGVCRDFTHLAITLCRCLNIPARYATGYLGDIGVPPVPLPMDFSAWFEVHLGGRWHTFDARHNVPRIGRIVMARGRDAADVAITTTFGPHQLAAFEVWTDEVAEPAQALEGGSGPSANARLAAAPL